MQDMQPALQLSAVSSDCVARSCVNWVGLCYSGGFRGYTRHGPYCGGFPEKTCSLGGNYPQHKVACEVFAHGGGGGGIVGCMVLFRVCMAWITNIEILKGRGLRVVG